MRYRLIQLGKKTQLLILRREINFWCDAQSRLQRFVSCYSGIRAHWGTLIDVQLYSWHIYILFMWDHNYCFASGVTYGVHTQLSHIHTFTPVCKMSIHRRALTAGFTYLVYLAHFIGHPPPTEDRKHCSGIDWLSECGVIALLILHWKYIFPPLLLWETDAVMRRSRVINEPLPLWGWIHRACNIDSRIEWFIGSPDTELENIIHLQWSMHNRTSNPPAGLW